MSIITERFLLSISTERLERIRYFVSGCVISLIKTLFYRLGNNLLYSQESAVIKIGGFQFFLEGVQYITPNSNTRTC